jgi:hypothetical protein
LRRVASAAAAVPAAAIIPVEGSGTVSGSASTEKIGMRPASSKPVVGAGSPQPLPSSAKNRRI